MPTYAEPRTVLIARLDHEEEPRASVAIAIVDVAHMHRLDTVRWTSITPETARALAELLNHSADQVDAILHVRNIAT